MGRVVKKQVPRYQRYLGRFQLNRKVQEITTNVAYFAHFSGKLVLRIWKIVRIYIFCELKVYIKQIEIAIMPIHLTNYKELGQEELKLAHRGRSTQFCNPVQGYPLSGPLKAQPCKNDSLQPLLFIAESYSTIEMYKKTRAQY